VGVIDAPAAGKPFVHIRSLALHPDGRLAVVDSGADVVTLFANGRQPMSVGSVGRLKGQFQTAYSAAWISDTLAVYDPLGSRVVFYTNGLTPLREAPALPMTGDAVVRFYPVSPGKAYLRSARRVGDRWVPAFIGFESSLAHDTITIPDPPPVASGAMCHDGSGLVSLFAWPGAPKPLVVPFRADGALATGVTDVYRVLLRGPANDSLATIERAVTTGPIPNQEWDAGVAPYTKFITTYGPASCSATPVRPANRSPLRNVTVSNTGELWVSVLDGDHLVFDVYGMDGHRRGTLAAPDSTSSVPVAVAGDRLALVTLEPGGGNAVRLYRIVR
jgi:hypothetical protein